MANENKNLVIIDADSLIYLVGYELQDLRIEILGIEKLNEIILSILVATRSGSYVGFFGKIGGRNFRYAAAKTKEYKGNRKKEKEEWFEFWEPVLKEHMEVYWKFQAVDKVEADDAVSIAYYKYRDKYNKVTVASPDKDLRQIAGYHYDYRLRLHLDISKNAAIRLLMTQMFLGDTADNIPGLPGIGKKGAAILLESYDDDEDPDKFILDAYKTHFKITLKDKLGKKQEKEYLDNYKKEHNIKRWNGELKSTALKDFKIDTSSLLTDEEIVDFFDEMKVLLTMLTTEEEGKKLGFEVPPVNTHEIDWETIISYIDDLSNLPEEQSFDFLNDI
jgi:5'-3' exonuclease